jgi:hypothetical protein
MIPIDRQVSAIRQGEVKCLWRRQQSRTAVPPSLQLYGQMMDDDTRAKAMRLDWDDFKVRDTRWFIRCCTRPRSAVPRVCSGRVCILLFYLHRTVHTHCTEAHHSEPRLCDCNAESKATPTCDTCDNSRRHIQRPAERILRQTVKRVSRISALLGAHREYLGVESERKAGAWQLQLDKRTA